MVKELGARWKRRANGDQQQWLSRAVRTEEKGMSMVVERIPEPELARHMVEGHAVHQQEPEGRGRAPSQFCSEGSWAGQVLHVFCLWKFCQRGT